MDAVRWVLVRPESGGNVGAAARALKNMGQAQLWLVQPRAFDAGAAARLAHGAADVLADARSVDSLDDAIRDCRWVVGATRRAGRRRAALWTPRALAAAVRRAPERRPLALVFGPEADGLSSEDLARCHDLVRIPAAAAQPSLNLAQAVLVLAYELFLVGGGTAAAVDPAEAAAAELEGLYAHLETMLLAVGFARPETAPHRMVTLRRLFGRARLRTAEVRMLRGLCRQAAWAAGRSAGRRV
jgi:TrmH family RNA methyltransferase